MSTDRDKLREARRLINDLSRICRQTNAYFEGISVLDQAKVRAKLKDAIRTADRFLASN